MAWKDSRVEQHGPRAQESEISGQIHIMIVNHVTLLMAMKDEASPVIKKLGLSHVSSIFSGRIPFQCHQGSFKGRTISLITSGLDPLFGVDNVATQPATLMAYLTIDRLSADLLINDGTAGGFFESGSRIGDVYLSGEEICFHDRRIPLPGFDEYGVGHYHPYDCGWIGEQLGLKRGNISTGNSLHHSDEDLELIKTNQCVIKDMEAAAIAWVCQMMMVPMFAVKSVTDLLDKGGETEKQFSENMSLAVENLASAIPEILGVLFSGNEI